MQNQFPHALSSGHSALDSVSPRNRQRASIGSYAGVKQGVCRLLLGSAQPVQLPAFLEGFTCLTSLCASLPPPGTSGKETQIKGEVLRAGGVKDQDKNKNARLPLRKRTT